MDILGMWPESSLQDLTTPLGKDDQSNVRAHTDQQGFDHKDHVYFDL